MKNEQGMTLVELITTMAIMAIIGIIIFNFLFTSSDVFESRKLANEQTIIMDHLRTVVTDEIRYMEVLVVPNKTVNEIDGCHVIISKENSLIKYMFNEGEGLIDMDNSIELTSSNIIGTHSVIVEFEKASDNVLRVRVFLDSTTDYKREEVFTVRLMNIGQGNTNVIGGDIETNNTVQQIYYKDSV